MCNILIVDNDETTLEILKYSFEGSGFSIETSLNALLAVEKIRKKFYNIVMTDLIMPEIGGIELLKNVKHISPETEVIIYTAFGEVETAVEAMKNGAYHYIKKPYAAKELKKIIDSAIQKQESKMNYLGIQSKNINRFGALLGSSNKMKKVYALIEEAAKTDVPVLVTGESGTGKRTTALEIHKRSPQGNAGRIEYVHCISGEAEMLECEIFGRNVNAKENKKTCDIGKLQLASNGTIYINHISHLPQSLQLRLLKFIDTSRFDRENSKKPVEINTRVIVSAKENLSKFVEQKKFVKELYHRLSGFVINAPPLRQRTEDIPALAYHFLLLYNLEHEKNISIPLNTIQMLKRYDWPGNVREFIDTINQSAANAEGETLEPSHIRFGEGKMGREEIVSGNDGSQIKETVKGIEETMIRDALMQSKWNQARAAKILGMKRTSLQYKMKKYDITPPAKSKH